MTALLFRGQLVLEMDGRRTGLDQRSGQLEGVQGATESGLRIGHDRCEEIRLRLARSAGVFQRLDLVGPHQRLVDPPDRGRTAVDRIEALVGVGLTGGVAVGGDLPARQVDRLQPGPDMLNRLASGVGAKGRHKRPLGQQPPQSFGAAFRQRVTDVERTAQAEHRLPAVAAAYALPTLRRPFRCRPRRPVRARGMAHQRHIVLAVAVLGRVERPDIVLQHDKISFACEV